MNAKISKNSLIYLCSVYSLNANEITKQLRYERVLKLTALLLQDNYLVYSPIVHNHNVAVQHQLKAGYDFWMRFDREILRRCDVVCVMDEGPWQESVGVTDEVCYGLELGKKVYLIRRDGDTFKIGKTIKKCQRVIPKN